MISGRRHRSVNGVKFDPDKHYRRSIRLRGYDYSQPGAYFVTICIKDRECLFGEVVEGKMQLNDAGRTVQAEWLRLPERFQSIGLDEFVIIPNHLHGIISVGAPFMAPDEPGAINHAPTLGEMVRTFKAASTHAIRRSRASFQWQRNYYEHVIRNEHELALTREYIANNPAQWALDHENPNCVGA